MLKTDDFDPSMDAVIAAPDFHRVLLENDEIRVLEVVVPVGVKEPFHTHQWQSIFVVFGTPRLRYFVPQTEEHLFEIEPQQETGVLHLAPEGMHSLQNVDVRELYAFRIEMKRAPSSGKAPIRGPVLEAGVSGEGLYLENPVVRLRLAGTDGDIADSASLLLRREEPAGSVKWLDPETSKNLRHDDILLTLKYL